MILFHGSKVCIGDGCSVVDSSSATFDAGVDSRMGLVLLIRVGFVWWLDEQFRVIVLVEG